MKRNWILAILCLLCALLLYGCGTASTPAASAPPVEVSAVPEPSSEPEPAPSPEESAPPAAILPDAALKPDTEDKSAEASSQFDLAKSFAEKPLSELIEAIGEPVSSSYATSCLGPGQDGELIYDGFKVYTYDNGETETILDVLPD